MVWSELTDHLEVLYGAAAALVIVLLLTPAVGSAARYLRLVDRRPEGERDRPSVPRLGGLAMFLGVIVPSVAFLPLSGAMKGIVLGAAVATTVGAIDDFRLPAVVAEARRAARSPRRSPPGSVSTCSASPSRCVGVHQVPHWIGIPMTVIGIVAVMNMVNFLDGLDGLAAGVCAISGATFCVIELDYGRVAPAVLAAIVCGACLGFLRHNFYPARIFMGDSGALLLGYTLATVSVQGLLKTAALATLVLPLLVLAVPVLDTSFVVAKRLKSGQPIYVADARHLHHRFMRIGFSQRRAVVYLWTWCATLALAALATRFAPPHHHGDWNVTNLAIDVAAGVARDRVLALRRLRARDRDAREPAGAPPPPRGGTHRRLITAADELLERLVEPRRVLDGVACSGQHEPLGAEPLAQHVRHGFERRLVAAGDDEHGIGERLERDLGFVRSALRIERLGSLLEVGRQRVGQRKRRADVMAGTPPGTRARNRAATAPRLRAIARRRGPRARRRTPAARSP